MRKIKIELRDIGFSITGIFIYAAAINCFTVPNKIAPGGAGGIAALVNYATGFPIGLFVFLFNIPLLIIILWKKYFSHVFILKIGISSVLLSVMTDVVVVYLPTYRGNPLLASMFGGAMMGTGLALVNMGNSDTGGITLLGLIIRENKSQFQAGKLITILNMSVVFATIIFYKNIDSILYSALTVYISGKFMDNLIENSESKNLILVIAESTDKVRQVFFEEREGVTVLKGEGGYSSEVQRIVLCVTERKKCEMLQKKIYKVDDKALVVITEVERVRGKRYRSLV